MNRKEILKKYHARLTKHRFVKSLTAALILGFLALLGFETFVWMKGYKFYWLGAPVLVGVTAVFTPLFYTLKYRFTTKQLAAAIDELGLEERVLTMVELEDDDSAIAQLQKQDTVNALNRFNTKLLKLALSVPVIVGLIVTGLLGLGMTTVSALSANDVIKNGSDVIDQVIDNFKDPVFYEVEYDVYMGEGVIEGELFQVVEEGFDATPVLAVPADDYMFITWSDGVEDPYRIDISIMADLKVYAVFMPMEDGPGGQGMPMDGEGDMPSDLPMDMEGQPGEGPDDEGDPSTGMGGVYEPHNQVLDGETYYGGQVYENAHQDAMEALSGDTEKSDAEKALINLYYKAIAK